MLKTISYEIWPKATNFATGIETIVATVNRELGTRVTSDTRRKADSTFMIYVDDSENVRFEKFRSFLSYFKTVPSYTSFECNISFSKKFNFFYAHGGIWIQHRRQEISVTCHSENVLFVDRSHEIVRGILKLEKVIKHDVDEYRWKHLDPKVFISRHFDDFATKYFNDLNEFLSLLGFSVTQGEEYVSGSIPDKVKHRMNGQEIIIVVVSGMRDHDWLIAEIGYAMGQNKHVVILKEKGSTMNMTIMGKDFEYIEFDPGWIQKSFSKLLREFRSIRIKGIF